MPTYRYTNRTRTYTHTLSGVLVSFEKGKVHSELLAGANPTDGGGNAVVIVDRVDEIGKSERV